MLRRRPPVTGDNRTCPNLPMMKHRQPSLLVVGVRFHEQGRVLIQRRHGHWPCMAYWRGYQHRACRRRGILTDNTSPEAHPTISDVVVGRGHHWRRPVAAYISRWRLRCMRHRRAGGGGQRNPLRKERCGRVCMYACYRNARAPIPSSSAWGRICQASGVISRPPPSIRYHTNRMTHMAKYISGLICFMLHMFDLPGRSPEASQDICARVYACRQTFKHCAKHCAKGCAKHCAKRGAKHWAKR